jgi:DNA modification methylase
VFEEARICVVCASVERDISVGEENMTESQFIGTFRNKIIHGSMSEQWPIPDESIDLIVTSPPYWQHRDNGGATASWWCHNPRCNHDRDPEGVCRLCGGEWAQLGQERNPQDYIRHLVKAFTKEAMRTLKADGQMWVNIGDKYSRGLSGLQWGEATQRLLIPYRVAIALQDEGWVLRNELIWAKGVSFEDGTTKGGGMPSAVHNRLNHSHEVFFGFIKPAHARRPYYINYETAEITWNRREGFKKVDYHSNLDPLRLQSTWVNEDGQRTDLYGRLMGSAKNAGGSPKQHSLSQPNLYIQNHPLGKNPGSVWQVNINPFVGQKLIHTSPYPQALIERIVEFGSPPFRCQDCDLPLTPIYIRKKKEHIIPDCGCHAERVRGLVFDPFMGSGTTALAANAKCRDFCGLELNEIYVKEARQRISTSIQERLVTFK